MGIDLSATTAGRKARRGVGKRVFLAIGLLGMLLPAYGLFVAVENARNAARASQTL